MAVRAPVWLFPGLVLDIGVPVCSQHPSRAGGVRLAGGVQTWVPSLAHSGTLDCWDGGCSRVGRVSAELLSMGQACLEQPQIIQID